MLGTLRHTAESAHRAEGVGQILESGSMVLSNYFVPPAGRGAAGLALLALAMLSAGNRRLWPALLTALAMSAVWLRFASYDVRNLVPAIPLLAFPVTHGGARLLAMFPENRAVRRGLLASALCVLAAGATIVAPGTLRAIRAADPGRRVLLRVAAQSQEMPERVKMFFPEDYRMWHFLSRLRLLSAASRLVAVAPIYRWHANSIYGACSYDPAVLAPGDLFVAIEPYRPPVGTWTMLQNSTSLRAWLWERRPVAVDPSAAKLHSTDRGSPDAALAIHSLPADAASAGLSIVWRVDVEAGQAGSGLRACAAMPGTGRSDPEASGFSVDAGNAASGTVSYSGTLAIRPSASGHAGDAIRFGLCGNPARNAAAIRAFQYSTYPW
jgi:hypothetical protein